MPATADELSRLGPIANLLKDMEAESLFVEGFRRFADPTTVFLSGKLVAMVGSNEAGKSSLLRALEYLSDNSPIVPSDKTHLGEKAPTIRLRFYLEAEDLAVSNLPVGTRLDVVKTTDGIRRYGIYPPPKRDLSQRKGLAKSVRRFSDNAKVLALAKELDESLTDELLESLHALLNNVDVAYDGQQFETLNEFASSISTLADETSLPKYAAELADQVAALIGFEKAHDPAADARRVLVPRVPPILVFGPEDRDLEVPFSLSSFIESDETPSKQLAEIIKMSGLDLAALADADESGNEAVRTGLLSEANEKLRELSQGVWSQSDASLYFVVTNGGLDLLVEHRAGFDRRDRYNNIRDRSDGYRQFVALQVFAFLQDTDDTLLLIDELEQHLHYDAQADLIQLLQREPSISKVIYTTHSAGALPEDLGAGVKLVRWDDERKKISRVDNKFWHKNEQSGFRPLLFGMGATTLAFFPTRRALVAEGMTEVLLLPRLLREALSVATLGFQVIGGLANIRPKGLPMIDSASNGVIYLTDADKSGRDITAGLTGAGVDPGRIYSVGKMSGALTIEDLIDEAVWREAVIKVAGKNTPPVPENKLAFPANGRVAALPASVGSRKIEIAYEILDIAREDPRRSILAKKKRGAMAKIAKSMQDALGITSD